MGYPAQMDVLAVLRERLDAHGVPYRHDERSVAVLPRSATGFVVSIVAGRGEYVVSFDGWHDHFASGEEALRCFAFGMSTRCRLRVTMRGGRACAWQVESADGRGGWCADSETGLLLAPWWARKTTVYLQNDFWPGEVSPNLPQD
jgi:hypothetical protein